jgi:predicted secreted hydrolase
MLLGRSCAIPLFLLALASASIAQPAQSNTSAASPRPITTLEFPRDLFEHQDTQMEWWYYTGNLSGPDGAPYGFELTFFRTFTPVRQSDHQSELKRAVFAHLSVSDLNGKKFHFYMSVPVPEDEQNGLMRGSSPWTIRVRDLKLSQGADAAEPQTLQGHHDNFGIDLVLTAQLPPTPHGVNGFVQKGPTAGRGSFYYSITRLATKGTLELDGTKVPVTGLAWNDHEFMHLSRGEKVPYWDWFAIQLTDGSSLMLYGLRRDDGKRDPTTMGTYVSPSGQITHLKGGQITLTPGKTWHSEASNTDYPIEWKIGISSLNLSLKMTTPLPQQEMVSPRNVGSITYWEGASRFDGSLKGEPINGVGYVEMTGYTKD